MRTRLNYVIRFGKEDGAGFAIRLRLAACWLPGPIKNQYRGFRDRMVDGIVHNFWAGNLGGVWGILDLTLDKGKGREGCWQRYGQESSGQRVGRECAQGAESVLKGPEGQRASRIVPEGDKSRPL